MALIEIQWNPDRRFLRQFSAMFLLFFVVVGALRYFRHDSPSTAWLLWTIGGTLGIMGLAFPAAMRYVYLAWMIAIYPLAWVVSHLLLSGIFLLVVTPLALLMRLTGRDPLHRRIDRSEPSCWSRRETSVDSKRYFRQF